jgi:hypothetical protein
MTRVKKSLHRGLQSDCVVLFSSHPCSRFSFCHWMEVQVCRSRLVKRAIVAVCELWMPWMALALSKSLSGFSLAHIRPREGTKQGLLIFPSVIYYIYPSASSYTSRNRKEKTSSLVIFYPRQRPIVVSELPLCVFAGDLKSSPPLWVYLKIPGGI